MLTVALCTHNPRRAFIEETLASLRAQSRPVHAWDLLIVDNASSEPLADWLDLSWHPHARIVREERLGTAHARHRALLETIDAELLLFVDDDNILAPDYLETGLRIGQHHRELGCWGGQLLPRFESAPPPWFDNYAKYLAIFTLTEPSVATQLDTYDSCPPSAGCFIRHAVRERYLQLLSEDPRRLTLGAKGDVQVRGEDLDLVLTAFDLDLELGRFPQLKLVHCMPSSRLSPEYVAGLLEGTSCGTALLEFLRFGQLPSDRCEKLHERLLVAWRARRLPSPIGQFYEAEIRGQRNALGLIRSWQ